MGIEKKIKDELRNVIKAMSDLPFSRPFREPVDGRRYPDYYLIVSKPMDLRTLRKNLIDGKYETAEEFYEEGKLIFANCKAYNVEPSNPVRQQCDELERNFEYQWQNFVARRCVEQGLENVNKETAEVLSLVHARKRKEPEPEIVNIPVPLPVKKPKVPKPESSFSFSLDVSEEIPPQFEELPSDSSEDNTLKLKLTMDLESDNVEVEEKMETALKLKLPDEDRFESGGRKEPSPPLEELDLDKGRFSHVIKFTVPEMVPEPAPVPVKVSLPAPPVPDSEEYIRAVLSPFLSPSQSLSLRQQLLSLLHKHQYSVIPLGG